MNAILAAETTALNITNVLLGLVCLGLLLAVVVAAWLDARERRRWKSMVPPCWPPPGVDPADAYAEAGAKGSPGAAHPHGKIRS